VSIDNCDLRLWRPASPGTRPGSPPRVRRGDDDRATTAGADVESPVERPEAVAAQG
jgi:hypothetical protein